LNVAVETSPLLIIAFSSANAVPIISKNLEITEYNVKRQTQKVALNVAIETSPLLITALSSANVVPIGAKSLEMT
jgi:hypothetical protein